jgi:peptide-methionine (S)-S-oxide reductase
MRVRTLIPSLGLALGVAALAQAAPAQGKKAEAIFAGGCFWCMEPPFDKIGGVLSTTSGYIGGTVTNPTYEQVSSGRSGHLEAVKIEYDPTKVSYEKLLEIFWVNIDPLDGRGQFCDKGEQYESAIFVLNNEQRQAAEKSLANIHLDGKVQTSIRPAAEFYAAEEYHQDYYKKNPVRYNYYRWGCGRDKRLKQLWGEAAEH